ncbi:hypothetical protein NLI96_g6855 [Meripilus lineatus]|uniref:MARVEL domain-containing protein n=1 Tax=Meripilus lineatus TaxID=2056292 RepID=A0AAD5YHS5_9APHY|nr:hypothetical protein NLI96_g6855 [Physisporinus lineatus]
MYGISQAVRRAGTWILVVANFILLGLFTASLAVGSGGSFEAGCLVLQCASIAVILGTEYFAHWCGGREPYDLTYTVSAINVFMFNTLSAILFSYRFSEEPVITQDFNDVGNPLVSSYTALVLSWLSMLLAFLCSILTYLDKRRANLADSQGRPAEKVDWNQRPLPLTIVDVEQNPDPARFLDNHSQPPRLHLPPNVFRTTYNSWPDQL